MDNYSVGNPGTYDWIHNAGDMVLYAWGNWVNGKSNGRHGFNHAGTNLYNGEVGPNHISEITGDRYVNVRTNIPANGLDAEAAGAGNSPTAANWEVGDDAENTDDSTVWKLAQSGWDQIG